MGFFVYILANSEDAELYKGFTENPLNRLQEHNAHGTQYTSKRRSWRYVYLSEFSSKKEALIFEKKIKRWNRVSLEHLICSASNQLSKILGVD